MRILPALPDIKQNPERIKGAAQNQKNQTCFRQFGNQFSGGKHNHPAHQHIEADRPCFGAAARCQEFQSGAENGQPPNDAEQRPADGAAHVNQQKRRI